jgi:MoxR-like ATPase
MKIKHYCAVATFFTLILSADNLNVSHLTSIPVKVQLDFSNFNGETTKILAEHIVVGTLEGIAKGTSNGNVEKNLTQTFQNTLQQGSQAFATAARDAEFRNNLGEGGRELSRSFGHGLHHLNDGLEESVFPELSRGYRGFIGSFINIENAIRFSLPIAFGMAILVTGYYGCKTAWEVFKHKILNPKPIIMLPQSKIGRWDRVKRWWKKYKTPAMVFNQSVKDRLHEIQETTKTTKSHIKRKRNVSYNNVLLYGKPGTGKTLFAQILADYTDMDFIPVTAASLLQSGIQGTKYINEIFESARKSRYGTIIFIDEADALFVDRNLLNPESDHYKVLNHLLALTGSASNKFMIIAATNHSYVMDEAMGRRFQDRVLMPLPDLETRIALIELYGASIIFNEKENGKRYVTTAKKLFTPQCMAFIAEKSNGLSHAEVKDMIAAMHKKAGISIEGILTMDHINDAIHQALVKYKALEQDYTQRTERLKKYTSPSSIPSY